MTLIRDVRVYAFLSPCRCGSGSSASPLDPLQGWEGQRVQKPVREPSHTAPHPTFRQPAVLLPINGPATKGRNPANTAELSKDILRIINRSCSSISTTSV